ncbi:MAG: hypothetical protein ACRCU6_12475 [Fusobacteriaceae bacterium]
MKGGRDRPITDKEEIFLQELIKGKSQREAYRIAYPNSKMKDKSVDVAASKLLKKDKVLLRYKELRQKTEETTLWSYEKAQEELLEMLKDSKSDGSYTGRYNAIKELNALAGFYDKKKEEKEDKAGNFFDKLGDLI